MELWAIQVFCVMGLVAAILIYPWITVVILFAMPVVKLAAQAYIPFFRTVDLTVATYALALLTGIYAFVRRREKAALVVPWKMLGLVLLMAVLLWIGCLWTTAPNYGLRKAFRFTGMGVAFLLMPMLFVNSKQEGHRIIRMMIVVGVLSSLAIVLAPQTELSEIRYAGSAKRGTFLASDPNWPATLSVMGMMALATLFVIKGAASKLLRYSAFLVIPLGLACVFLTGSRSAMLTLVLVALAMPIFAGRKNKARGYFLPLILLPVAMVVSFRFVSQSGIEFLGRWHELGQEGGSGLGSRMQHYTFCLTQWWGRPFLGHGSGSFAMDLFHVDEPMWPHNILLEALYETGIFGFVVMLMLLVMAVQMGLRGMSAARSSQDRALMAGPSVLALVMLLWLFTHTGFADAKYLFFFMGLQYANYSLLMRENELADWYDYQYSADEAMEDYGQGLTPA